MNSVAFSAISYIRSALAFLLNCVVAYICIHFGLRFLFRFLLHTHTHKQTAHVSKLYSCAIIFTVKGPNGDQTIQKKQKKWNMSRNRILCTQFSGQNKAFQGWPCTSSQGKISSRRRSYMSINWIVSLAVRKYRTTCVLWSIAQLLAIHFQATNFVMNKILFYLQFNIIIIVNYYSRFYQLTKQSNSCLLTLKQNTKNYY